MLVKKMMPRFAVHLGACLTLAACAAPSSQLPDSYRYRLTVEVETPTGPARGSGVIEVGLPGFVGRELVDRSRELDIRGQAVPIDLPDGRTFFALLGSREWVDWAGHVMVWMTPTDRSSDNSHSYYNQLDDMLQAEYPKRVPFKATGPLASAETPDSLWPSFARFDDPRLPHTFSLVNPQDLGKTLGDGYRIKAVVVQLTEEPVTTGLERRLPWLTRSTVQFIDVPEGPLTSPVPGTEVTMTYFSRGILK